MRRFRLETKGFPRIVSDGFAFSSHGVHFVIACLSLSAARFFVAPPARLF